MMTVVDAGDPRMRSRTQGGGHVSYFGNDPAHYDIKTGRWSIGYPPQYALEYNYGLSGPGPWAFNLGPWGNHNYQAYAYDPTCKRLVYIKEVGTTWTQMYDPVKREWPFEEKITAPFALPAFAASIPRRSSPGGSFVIGCPNPA